MPTIGKCLSFYLRYPKEMDRLCGTDEHAADGLEDAGRAVEMAHRVYEMATLEAVAFLEACADAVQPHVLGLCPGHVRRARVSRKKWYTSFAVGKGMPMPNRPMGVGVSLWPDPIGLMVWIWLDGQRRAEIAVEKVIEPRADPSLKCYSPGDGTVYLARIPLPVSDRFDEVDASPLIDQVLQVMCLLTADDISQLLVLD